MSPGLPAATPPAAGATHPMSNGSTRIRTRAPSLTPRAIRAACALFNAAANAAPLPGGTRINARSPCSPLGAHPASAPPGLRGSPGTDP